MVIFSGVWAIVNGTKSSQCRGRVSRPAASNRLYKGVAGNGVSSPKMGRPGGHVRTCCKVRSATPGVSLSMLYTLDVRSLYPAYLIWVRALVRLALASVLYYLRPREAHWQPTGHF